MSSIGYKEVCELLGVPGSGEPHKNRVFARVSGFHDARPDSIVFAQDAAALEAAKASGAGLILARDGAGSEETAGEMNGRLLRVRNPKLAFALVGGRLAARMGARVHPSAVIEGEIGLGTSVGAASVIEAGAVVGKDCRIGARVTILKGTLLGDRCVVQAGAVLGSAGFGYAQQADGRSVLFPQIGTLRVEDDVEIGANTTIDRGALGETVIGRGTKIDNLVHIAHNCRIGENVLIAAQVGMAGSCVIEDGAMLGGQVGLGEKVTIGKGVILGGQGGVLPGKRLDGAGVVFWGTPAQPVREYLRGLARMRRG